MKAIYNHVSMEGTPKEIIELMKLMDERFIPKWNKNPIPPYQPYTFYPSYTPYIGTSTWTGGNITTYQDGTNGIKWTTNAAT